MKKLTALLFLLLSVTCLKSQWITVNSGVSSDLKSVYFINSTNGFVVGTGGVILKTINGGVDWDSINSGITENLNDICFISPEIGYAVGANGTIIRTENSGETWSPVTSNTSYELFSISFSDPKYGVCIGFDGVFLNTADSGLTWNAQTGPLGDIPYARSVQMVNKDTGYAVGGYTSVFKTTDGGANWDGKYLRNVTGAPYPHFNSVFFITAEIGYALGISFYDGTEGKDLIYKTINGGEDWTDLTKETFLPIQSACFNSINEGYGVGKAGTIIRTIDGGDSWIEINCPVANNLNSICYANSENAFIVGDHGTILQSSNANTDLNLPVTLTNYGIYPNPASDMAFVNSIGEGINYLRIYDLNGKLVYETQFENTVEIDLKGFAKGVYIAECILYNSDSVPRREKFIVE